MLILQLYLCVTVLSHSVTYTVQKYSTLSGSPCLWQSELSDGLGMKEKNEIKYSGTLETSSALLLNLLIRYDTKATG